MIKGAILAVQIALSPCWAERAGSAPGRPGRHDNHDGLPQIVAPRAKDLRTRGHKE